MIITRLQGGLGNQMFQYSAARSLGLRLGLEVKCDISDLESSDSRSYKLDKFVSNIAIATDKDLRRVHHRQPNGKIEKYLFKNRIPTFKESSFEYSPLINEINSSVYLQGYWQSEKYFKDYASQIKLDLIFKNFTIPDPLRFEISKPGSVSVHFRRGDYVTDKTASFVLGTLDQDYYSRAIEKISENVEHPHLYIFSDDIPWVEKNIKLNLPHTLITDEFKDYEQLELMSLCHNHVLANSSFSWWGAWLGRYANGITIAPKRWFNKVNYDVRDLIPSNWSTL